MLEKKRLLESNHAEGPTSISSPIETIKNETAKDSAAISPLALVWDGTPTLRKTWHSKSTLNEFLDRDDDTIYTKGLKSTSRAARKPSYESLAPIYEDERPKTSVPTRSTDKSNDYIAEFLTSIPGLLIGVVLTLFLSISFGQAFFPTGWIFPPSVPRTIGVQMFLFSTVISQVCLTTMSSFPMAVGQMMVENIPFMHVIANIAIQAQGMGEETFSTVFFIFASSTVFVGLLFYILGHFELGNVIYFVPKHVIVGCIGGIGIFLIVTSIEVSTDVAWEWTSAGVQLFFTPRLLPLWMTSVFFAIILRGLGHVIRNQPMLPPLYFISIPFIVYAVIYITRIPLSVARAQGWFFSEVSTGASPFLMWELIDVSKVNWASVGKSIPTVLALSVFSLMHVPINIPSLSLSTGQQVDMNQELVAHGYSNAISGILGGLPNYLCYSTSVTYFKCNGRGKISGLLLAAITTAFFFLGPSVVTYFPRCMAGCLLFHVGVDLTKEALLDSLEGFDWFEYGSVVAITIVMTTNGMTSGLELGVFCAALTFTLQASEHVDPIRTVKNAVSLRSSRWRSQQASEILDTYAKHITVVQLQGHIFFGNATSVYEKVEALLEDAEDPSRDVWLLILDFTLVLGIDSSAVERITKLFETCRNHDVRLCFARGSSRGFPCAAPLTEKLRDLSASVQDSTASERTSPTSSRPRLSLASSRKVSGKAGVARAPLSPSQSASDVPPPDLEIDLELNNVAPKLQSSRQVQFNFDGASSEPLPSVSDRFLYIAGNPEVPTRSVLDRALYVADTLDDALAWCEDVLVREISPTEDLNDPYHGISRPVHLRQLHSLCPNESSETVDKLLSYFEPEKVSKGAVLWHQGDASTRAILLCEGKLTSSVQGEESATEVVSVGYLCGEYGLINGQLRQSAITAVEPSVIFSLRKEKFEKMLSKDPYLAFVLTKICSGYLGHKVMHVANRLRDGSSLPI